MPVILKMPVMCIGIILKKIIFNLMKNINDLKEYSIECVHSNGERINAFVSTWFEQHVNPTIFSFISKDSYNLQGTWNIYYFEYRDSNGRRLKTFGSEKTIDCFYELVSKLEQENIKMLIKGCAVGYYMIPKSQSSLKTVKLTLGERMNKHTPIVCIFEPEVSVNNITTYNEQKKYYSKWLESIKGVPY